MADNILSFATTRDEYFHGNIGTLWKHVCPPTFGGGPLDPQPADRTIARNLMIRFDLILPPGHPVINMIGTDRLPMWIIENPDAADTPDDPKQAFPSPLIRTVQGEIVHARVGFKKNTHTIHWHGIEPTTMNDGVGKHSFEGNGNFVYQYQTNEAGTYFYHCHKNTTLHFEMGLFGAFIVDPLNPGITADNVLSAGFGFNFSDLVAPYTRAFRVGGGPNALRTVPGYVAGQRDFFGLSAGNAIPYHKEYLWVYDDMDSMWHYPEPHHNHNMQDCDENDPANPALFYEFGTGHFELNMFNPDVFTVSGVVVDPSGTPSTTDPRVAITAAPSERVLLRYLNAGYTITKVTLPVDGVIIAWDGHPLGLGGIHQFSSPYLVTAGTSIVISTARRFDMIFTGTGSGNATIDVYDWVSNAQLAQVKIPVNIPAA
jgi:hypothetical protein